MIVYSPAGLETLPVLKKGVWYLASPYSHPDAALRHARFKAVSRVAGLLYVQHGIKCFGPISMSAPIERELDHLRIDTKPEDGYAFWQDLDEAFFPHMAGCIRALLPGWETSNGMRHEHERFQEQAKTVVDLNPEEWFVGSEWALLKGAV